MSSCYRGVVVHDYEICKGHSPHGLLFPSKGCFRYCDYRRARTDSVNNVWGHLEHCRNLLHSIRGVTVAAILLISALKSRVYFREVSVAELPHYEYPRPLRHPREAQEVRCARRAYVDTLIIVPGSCPPDLAYLNVRFEAFAFLENGGKCELHFATYLVPPVTERYRAVTLQQFAEVSDLCFEPVNNIKGHVAVE